MDDKDNVAKKPEPPVDEPVGEMNDSIKFVEELLKKLELNFNQMAEGIVSKIDEISSRVEELESNLTEITQKNEFGEEILKLQAKVKQTQQNLDENSKELDEELNRLQQKSSSSTAPKEEKK